MHLIIDGYSDSKEILQDEQFVAHWLENYPPKIGMTKISPPYVVRCVGSNPQDWGISGFIFINESHIAIHTFVERNYVNIDVFSCKDFDTEKVTRDFQDKFQLVKSRTCLIDREWSEIEPIAAVTSGFAYHER